MTLDRVSKLVVRLPEAYVCYKGFFQNVEIRVEGLAPRYTGGFGKLFVRAYCGEDVITYQCNPKNTMATARRHAKIFAEELARTAAYGREQGWAEHAEYSEHVRAYRLVQQDARRAAEDAYWDLAA